MNVRLASVGMALLFGVGLTLALVASVTQAEGQDAGHARNCGAYYASAATVRYVAPGGACGGASPCYGTIQAAVDAAVAGDEVRVAAGVYTGVSARAGMTQSVFLDKPLTVAGGYTTGNWLIANPAANATVIDAQGLGRGLVISGTGAATTIQGLRITGGNAGDAYFGGGVYAVSARVVFSNNWTYGNAAGVGAGLHLDGCQDAVLADNRIYENNATDEGGGVALWDSAGATLRRNQVYRNTSGGAGGGASVTVSDNVLLIENAFHQNGAAGEGGGLVIMMSLGGAVAQNQVYANVSDSNGGGISAAGGIYTFTHNQIYSNTAVGMGGGLMLAAAFPSEISGNQVFSNTAGECGGGVSLAAGFDLFLDGNRISGNSAFDGGGLCLNFNDGSRLTNNDVSGNRAAGNGGGAYVSDISPVLESNRFYSNTAEGAGGGLYIMWILDGADLTANQVYSNSAQAEGGGIAVVAADALRLSGNRIWGNVANGAGGGGLYMVNSADSILVNNVINANRISGAAPGAGLALDYVRNLRLLHTTISGNRGGAGSALFVTDGRNDGSPPAASVSLTNTILVSHTTGIHVTTGNRVDLSGILWYGTAVTVTKGATATVTARQQFTGDPAFARDGYHLMMASAARDRGGDAGVAVDIDGERRPEGPGFDFGADEYASRRIYLPLIKR